MQARLSPDSPGALEVLLTLPADIRKKNAVFLACADCSGFVWRVFKDKGYTVPRTSWELRNVGREVSYSNAQPGDIVCYAGLPVYVLFYASFYISREI